MFFVKYEKNKIVQNCMEWQENWLKTIFGFRAPTHPKIERVCKTFLPNMKKIKIVKNFMEWRENSFIFKKKRNWHQLKVKQNFKTVSKFCGI